MRIEYSYGHTKIPQEVIGRDYAAEIINGQRSDLGWQCAVDGWELLIGPPKLDVEPYAFGDYYKLTWPAIRIHFNQAEVDAKDS